MGYTTYFQQKRVPTSKEWDSFKKDVKLAFKLFLVDKNTSHIKIADGHGELLLESPDALFINTSSESDGDLLLDSPDDLIINDSGDNGSELSVESPNVSNDEVLVFNGYLDDSSESVYITNFKYSDFNFTKTARKDYDTFLNIVLFLADKNMNGVLKITSDGEGEEAMFQPAYDFIKSHNLQGDDVTINKLGLTS
jgi:hypothetical protein